MNADYVVLCSCAMSSMKYKMNWYLSRVARLCINTYLLNRHLTHAVVAAADDDDSDYHYYFPLDIKTV